MYQFSTKEDKRQVGRAWVDGWQQQLEKKLKDRDQNGYVIHKHYNGQHSTRLS